MSREELLERSRQEVFKRVDTLLAAVRYASYERSAIPARSSQFFFDGESRRAVCTVLKDRFGHRVQEIIYQAECYRNHRFDLLGFTNLDYGAEIDWHCDQVHSKRAPRVPFYKIHYLDFDEVGDVKITWELNRHQHFVTLAKAYNLSGDERFCDELSRQWRSWHAENRYPVGVNWTSSLEVAIRTLSWIWTYFLLEGTPAMSEAIRSEWLRALAVNARHIERYDSTYFSANTHLLGEGVALFFVGTLFPELASARRWQERGWNIILRQAQCQVRSDGFYFEQSTYYHVYAVDCLLHSMILASINGVQVPVALEETISKMLEALYLLCRTRVPPMFGDDDGGRLWDPRRNRATNMSDPLATGAILLRRAEFKAVARDLTEEALWLLGDRAIALWDELEECEPAPGSMALRASGLYMMSGDNPSEQITIDAGPHGALNGGHAHADALSICLCRNYKDLLIDPGTFEYVNTKERNSFRATRVHNTLQVDGRDQADTDGPFGWKSLPSARADLWVCGRRFDLFAGRHEGYCRLNDPVLHRRWVFSMKSTFCLVRDVAEGERAVHRFDIHWHLGPELTLQPTEQLVFRADDGDGLAIIAPEEHQWTQEVCSTVWSPVYGKKERALLVRFAVANKAAAEFCVALVPLERTTQDVGVLSAMGKDPRGAVSGYRFHTQRESYSILFARSGEAWTFDSFASDAEFVCLKTSDYEKDALMFCNGSWLEIDGKRVVNCASPVTCCERTL